MDKIRSIPNSILEQMRKYSDERKSSRSIRHRSSQLSSKGHLKILTSSNPRTVIIRVVFIFVVMVLIFVACLLIHLLGNGIDADEFAADFRITGTTRGSLVGASKSTVTGVSSTTQTRFQQTYMNSKDMHTSTTAISTSQSSSDQTTTTTSFTTTQDSTPSHTMIEFSSTIIATDSKTNFANDAFTSRTTEIPIETGTEITITQDIYESTEMTTTTQSDSSTPSHTSTKAVGRSTNGTVSIETTSSKNIVSKPTIFNPTEVHHTYLPPEITPSFHGGTTVATDTEGHLPVDPLMPFINRAIQENIGVTENIVTTPFLDIESVSTEEPDAATRLRENRVSTATDVALQRSLQTKSDVQIRTRATTSSPLGMGYSSTTSIDETTRLSIQASPPMASANFLTTIAQQNSTLTGAQNSWQNGSEVFFINGSYTFREANEACERKGAKAATKVDLEEAWKAGFSRCIAGWLGDMHVAKVTQSASHYCIENDVGVLFNDIQDPGEKLGGVYCTNKESKDEILSNGRLTDLKPSINWWTTVYEKDAYDLQHILKSVTSTKTGEETFPLLKSLNAVYICCNVFNITHTADSHPSTYIRERHSRQFFANSINKYRNIFNGVKIFAHVFADYTTMMIHGAATTNKTAIIKQLTIRARETGLNGIIMNYEPTENYTRQHTAVYIEFLNHLFYAAKDKGLSVGTMISSWGILKHYDLFARSNIDLFGSMGNTYYGRDVARNKINVNAMLEELDADRLQIGLGLMMQKTVKKPRRNYRWNEENLNKFLSWLKGRGIKRLHIYPGQWRRYRDSEQYFIESLAKF